MKLGILTFHHSLNYGAMLQAKCLSNYLESLGHEVEFVDYNPPHVEKGASFKSLLIPKPTKSYLKSIYLFYTDFRAKYKYNLLYDKFQSFREQSLSLSPFSFTSLNELRINSKVYDVIFLGSDQIWNPSDQFGLDPVYFGKHISSISKSIASYAPSFGSIERISKYSNLFPEILDNIDLLSIREKSGRDFLASLNIKSEVVPDPTFLDKNFANYAVMPTEISSTNPYVFSYILRDSSYMHSFLSNDFSFIDPNVMHFSAATPWRRWKKLGQELQLSPFEFIGAIKNSKITISNSFHGVVTSILTNTNFIALSLPGQKAGLSSRIYDILLELNLLNRFVKPEEIHSNFRQIYDSPIDWNSVNNKINKLFIDGSSFVEKALNHGS